MNNNFDWEDVENKISIIARKFDNIPDRYKEDLMQTLRIHAYYKSTDYYDLMRKAIDFWRQLQTQEKPEIPYFDLEALGNTTTAQKDSYLLYDEMMALVNKELNRPGHGKWDNDMLDLVKMMLRIICADIDERAPREKLCIESKTDMNHYINSRLNLSWISEETGIGYKRVVGAMQFLEDIVMGLAVMKKIDIPEEYLKGYYR